MQKSVLARGVAVALLLAGMWIVSAIPASAAVDVFLFNNPQQPDEENILFGTQETGNTVFGATTPSGVTVQFTSPTLITDPSGGQARVEGSPETIGINSITISVPNGAFNCLILDPQVKNVPGFGTVGTIGATLQLTVNTNLGTHVFTTGLNQQNQTVPYILGNGENFSTIVEASAGEVMQSVTLTVLGGGVFHDLKQPRICIAGAQVPEPASLAIWGLMISGLGLVIWRRRKK